MKALSPAFLWALSLPVIDASRVFRSTDNNHASSIAKRAPLPGTWTSSGCYTDNPAARTLQGVVFQSETMTANVCIAFCDAQGFVYSGTEYSVECYCGNTLQNGGASTALGECTMDCAGDATEKCGAGGRLNLYWSGEEPSAPPDPPTTVPSVGLWESLGCYTDGPGRTLTYAAAMSGPATIELCTTACFNAGFRYAGAEYSAECFCGNSFANGGEPTTSGCTMTCAGAPSTFCGGPNRLNVYNYTGTLPGPTDPPVDPPPGGGTPVVVPNVGLWDSIGCYTDPPGRTLTYAAGLGSPITIPLCTEACFNAGYRFAGAEYAVECWCGNSFANGGEPATSGCTMACAGAPSTLCGGPDRLNVYNYTGTPLPTPPVNPPVDPPPGGVTLLPVTDGLPAGWEYANCYVDNAFGRILINRQTDSATMTIASCIAACVGAGYSIAATEYSQECYCGNMLINGAVTAPESQCQMPCSGANTQPCGGASRLSVYSEIPVVALPVPTALTTGLSGNWAYGGCLREQDGGPRVFQYVNQFETTNAVPKCLKLCSDFGYPAAGLQGTECWCGDHTDIDLNGGVIGLESECNAACTGDPIHLCGGFQRLQLYEWTGGINTWHTPANPGEYKQLIGGVVIPLIATLGINNKITFLEKSGTSQNPNTTGAYELDLTYVNDVSQAWREMHVQTDVFCAASLILPDKAGRQINIGGWSAQSTFGIRLFTPDGAPGQPSVNDWEENPTTLTLQDGRWYPTALIMANGSILIVGGEEGSNGLPVPTLEILPKPVGGRTTKYLDFLFRTDPDNLYPFMFVLPSTNIFIGYYNEARILDRRTFETVDVLPNIPAAVNDPTGGRTYPLEGAAMILPQHAPYTDPVVVLICGGSTHGAGHALDNCVSIAPEAPNAEWVIERMPSKRVMPCMVNLPDGTFMIMNGAQQGYAGFGLANEPNLNAVLYDPYQPVHQRFSILSSTIVARMYHSEATLLHDGRILVSGSDPEHLNPDGTNKYPQEFRIEEYIPPYLSSGRTRPSYTIGVTDWAYGSAHSITVDLAHGTTGGMRVSLIAASSSTHGNTMGGRTIFPAFTCAGNVCTITAPPDAGVCPPGWHMLFVLDGPTPSVAQWVRIGGDPGQLGAWPLDDDFTRPGL